MLGQAHHKTSKGWTGKQIVHVLAGFLKQLLGEMGFRVGRLRDALLLWVRCKHGYIACS